MVRVDLIEKVTFEESLELWKELITRIYKRIFQAVPRPWIAQGITRRPGCLEQRHEGRGERPGEGGDGGQPRSVFSNILNTLTLNGNGQPQQHFEQG